MAGYSGTPLAKKLGIKEGHKLALLRAPEGFEDVLDLDDSVRVVRRLRAVADVIVFFVDEAAELERRFDGLAEKLEPSGGLWIAWPKKASGKKTDLDGNYVRGVGLASGLVDNKVCAIDETWSGLRFVVRKENRPK